jgi:hypothetical protein
MSWKSGNITFLFTLTERRPQICLIDHTGKRVYKGELSSSAFRSSSVLDVDARMSLPNVKISENVTCTRAKRFLGLGSGKSELVNGRNCKVFDSNMEIITDVRMEHLNQSDKETWNRCQAWLTSKKESKHSEEKSMELQEYLTGNWSVTSNSEEEARTFQARHEEKRSKTFLAQLWVCEDYPLSLQQQVMPILDLLNNLPCYGSVIGKIKNLISHELPQGFPVKINLPLYLSITAKINFTNVQSLDKGVKGVSVKKEKSSVSVEISDSVFQTPSGYHRAQNIAEVYESIVNSSVNPMGQESRKRKREVLVNQIQKLKG